LIHKLKPGLIPEPFSFGQYKSKDPAPASFFLSEFIDMDITTPPVPDQLGAQMADLHKKSESPTGKFSFHVVTCDGKMPHTVDWEESWAVFYGKLLRGVCKLDTEANGEWPETARVTEQVISQVIPRLLGNLKHQGEPIKPRIIHGDLWEPNLGVNIETGELIMYDVGSYYAHNEMDLGNWRAGFSRHLRADVYAESYLRHYPRAEPAAEFEDRLRLYSLKGSINYSAGHPGFKIRQA
jgi:protein-ribulosamine 3-kinase